MRRSLTVPSVLALLTAGLTAAVAPGASAGATCPVDPDGRMDVVATPGASYLRVDATRTTVDAYVDGAYFCGVNRGAVTSITMNGADNGVFGWQVTADSPFPGPISIANDGGDYFEITGSDRTERVVTGPRTGVLAVRRGDHVDRISIATLPEELALLLRDGDDVTDLVKGAGWHETVSISGTGGDKALVTGDGDDVVDLRGVGRDVVVTGAGEDRLSTGGGRDRLLAGADDDELHGGAGADRLFAAGGGADLVDGGPGDDAASWDRDDTRTSIETRLR